MYSLIKLFVFLRTCQSVSLYALRYLFVFPLNYFLIMFLLFGLPEQDFIIMFFLAKIFESPEHSLIIEFTVRQNIYQCIKYQVSQKVLTLPVRNLDWWLPRFSSVNGILYQG